MYILGLFATAWADANLVATYGQGENSCQAFAETFSMQSPLKLQLKHQIRERIILVGPSLAASIHRKVENLLFLVTSRFSACCW